MRRAATPLALAVPAPACSNGGESKKNPMLEALVAGRAVAAGSSYRDADGHPVQLDATYKNAWRATDGTYLQTDDPSFAPSAFGLEAQKLEALE